MCNSRAYVVVEVREGLRVLDAVGVLARRGARNDVGANELVGHESGSDADLVAPEVAAGDDTRVIDARLGLDDTC